MNLVLVARRVAPLEELAAELRRAHAVEVRVQPLDIGSPDAVSELRATTDSLDVGLLIYNAAYSPIGTFLDCDVQDHLEAVSVNVRGPLELVRAAVAEMGATAAIILHYGGNDWSQAQVAGLRATFEELGIEVVSETDADFSAETQVADIENALILDPSVIVSIPTDPVATEAAYQAAADQGVSIVFMDNVPQGFTAGENFVSVVSARKSVARTRWSM